jgi:hypothetical protein
MNILTLASIIIIGQFGLIIFLVIKITDGITKPNFINKVLKNKKTLNPRDLYIDIDNIKHTVDIPDVQNAKISVESKKMNNTNEDTLNKLKKIRGN